MNNQYAEIKAEILHISDVLIEIEQMEQNKTVRIIETALSNIKLLTSTKVK